MFNELTDNDIIITINPEIENYKFRTFLQNTKGKTMEKIFGNYFQTSEICILAGKTGVGKSTLAYTIADGITRGENILEQPNEAGKQSVLYYDFELTQYNISNRFVDYNAPENFYRPDVNQILLDNDGRFDFEIIRNDLKKIGAKVLIIDNISAIALKSLSDGSEALNVMKGLVLIRQEFDISILILAHTPKIRENRPLELYDIAGSSYIHNFIDSALIIQKSSQSDKRYLKQVKSRNAIENNDILIFDIVFDGWLQCKFSGFDKEVNHLDVNSDFLAKKISDLRMIAEKIIGNSSIQYNEFCNKYADEYNKSFENGRKILKELKQYNVVVKTPDDKYIINRNEKSSSENEMF